MQVTLELPDELARRLEARKDRLAQIIERGLAEHAEGASPHWREIIQFLASGPTPEQIIAFGPSTEHLDRSRDLLHRNATGDLNPGEEVELDELEHINHL